MDGDEIVQDGPFEAAENISNEYPHYFVLYGVLENKLELVCTNLKRTTEELFQVFITKRYNSCSLKTGEGNLCTLDINITEFAEQPMIAYYVKLDTPSTVVLSDNDDIESDCNLNQEFVICFITSSDVNLEFFRWELHMFCDSLMSHLNSDLTITRANAVLAADLETWYHVSLKYLCRCVQLLGNDIAMLLYLGSTNGNLKIEGAKESVGEDILRFLKCCGMSEVIGSVECAEKHQKSQPTAYLKFDDSSGGYSISGVVCDVYCEEWAKIILDEKSENPMFVKRVIENFKLVTVQSMNTFRRLLLEAESDYYALFKAFVFLKHSKQGAMLIQQSKIQETFALNDNTLDVLSILETFMDNDSKVNKVSLNLSK